MKKCSNCHQHHSKYPAICKSIKLSYQNATTMLYNSKSRHSTSERKVGDNRRHHPHHPSSVPIANAASTILSKLQFQSANKTQSSPNGNHFEQQPMVEETPISSCRICSRRHSKCIQMSMNMSLEEQSRSKLKQTGTKCKIYKHNHNNDHNHNNKHKQDDSLLEEEGTLHIWTQLPFKQPYMMKNNPRIQNILNEIKHVQGYQSFTDNRICGASCGIDEGQIDVNEQYERILVESLRDGQE